MSEKLSGVIERITFHNPDTGFVVLRVSTAGRRNVVAVVGTCVSVVAGEFLEAEGEWVTDREHGQQFKATTIRTTPPHTKEGIVKYLGSGLIKGIGPHYARKIVEVFGEKTLSVIDESPDFLREIKGVGPRRIQRIRESWQEQKTVRNVVVFLHSYGVGTAHAVRIVKHYGEQAIEMVRANPYRLSTDIWGIGFKKADDLGKQLGIDRASPFRARAALRFVLQQLSAEGHVGYPEAEVIQKAIELTNSEIPESVVAASVEDGRKEDELVRDRPGDEGTPNWLFLKPMFLAELGVARSIQKLCRGNHPLPSTDLDKALRWIEERMQIQLAPTQREAIRQATAQKVLVVTGGPGVGKTTIVRGILEIFAGKNLRCALCAPTGRAAKRLSETTGREAKTIHRLLEFDGGLGGFRRGRERPLDLDLLVVDESSMVDVVLMNQLLRAVPPWACLVLVGDVDQLPSVGPGTVLADIIRSGVVPVVRLTEIFRQAGQSWIVRAAHQVNEGFLPESAAPGQGDFYFIEAGDPEMIIDRLITMVRDRIPARFKFDPLRDVQILTPMNRSELGTQNLNLRLQEVLNPRGSAKQIERFGTIFRVGDKVLQTVNNYDKEVFNGDIGRITEINEIDQEVIVDFDNRPVGYDFHELDELTLAYALSIHRSQGSEYPAVIIPLHTQHYMLLQRNLLYTGITRGKKLVVLIGSRKALSLAVDRRDTALRNSALCWRLQTQAERDAKEEALT